MKYMRSVLLAVVVLLLISCGNNGKNESEVKNTANEVVVRQMTDLHLIDSVRSGGHLYVYEFLRTPSDSLPKVKDDMDDLFRDNTIRLTIRRDGSKYFDKTFTKAVFSSSIDNVFYKNAILDGIRFLRAEAGQGLTFSFAVSYPESDMSMPFLFTITDSGTYSFVKDENLDKEDGDSVYFDSDGV